MPKENAIKIGGANERERERERERESKRLRRFVKFLFSFFLFLFCFLQLKTPVFAYPSYPANSDLVIAGPYDTALSDVGTFGTFNSELITFGQKYRIRQNGTISRVRMYAANKTNLTGFYVKIWRKNGQGTYDLVGTSNNLINDIVAGSYSTIDLTTTITGVQEGDYIGYRIEKSTEAVNNFPTKTVSGASSYYVLTSGSLPTTNYAWESQTNATVIDSFEVYMQAPQFVFTGDSIISGALAHYSFCNATATTNIASTLEKQFSNLTTYNYQNMGISGQTTSQIAARFTADVVNLKPRVAVVEGGVNDIYNGNVTKATFLANWTTMLNAAQTNNFTIIVLKIMPWTNGTNVQMQTRDDWNASLVTLAAGYSNAIVVDISSYVGQFRAGGDASNLWDIQPTYTSDGVHFTTSGHGQIAQAIADALDSTAPTISSVTSTTISGSYTTGQAINITVNFSENVTTTGNVTVTLNTTPSRTCTFTVSGTNSGSCTYTVQSGDTSAGLDVSGISGTIKDAVLNQLTNFTPATTLTASKTIVIDTTVPTLSSKTTFSGWYTSNQTSTFTYTDSGSGIASGTPVTCTINTEGSAQTCSVTPNVCDVAGNCNTTPVTSNGANIDKTAPTISAVSSGTATSSGTIITWTTNENASSKVDYGLTNSYGSTTSETDTSSRVTSHSVALSSLSSCTTYHYRVRSIDTALNETIDSDNTFITAGCSTSTSTSSSNNSSSTSTTVCSDTAPGAKTPWLYGAIAQDSGSVLLYFTEADNPVNKYVLEYGTKSGDYPYGVQDMGVNTRGQMTFLVKSLSPNTTYYFKVRGGNGCATGSWSNEISAKTKPIFSTNNLDFVSSELNTVNNQTPTPTLIKKGATKTTETNPTVFNGYDVKVKVVDTQNKPVAGAKVTLHSTPRDAVTDKNGIAAFQNVEPGDHKVLIAYDGYKGEQSINLTGDVKEFDLNVKVQREAFSLSPLAYGIIVIMGLVITGLIGMLIKNKRKV